MSSWKYLALAAGALVLGGCATIPKPLAGNFSAVTPSAAQHGTAAEGAQVRWGGQIIRTEPAADHTCFYILARPLDGNARPQEGGDADGRFVACHSGFYDPEVFTKGREVTITGRLDGTLDGKVGQYDYTYPRVAASVIYLWKPRPRVVHYADPYYDPFWGPWGPYWGGFYGPYWYPPRVIYVRPAPPPPKSSSH